jgi:flavin-dependent dehydrogenase
MSQTDVVILGGGLAGLTLALQLRDRLPDLAITILERDTHPAPNATHKIGESMVEIGAHYLDTVLKLKEHLRDCHFKKFGFRFFFSEGQRAIDQVTELGASDYLETPGYQIDRGILENHLGELALARGILFLTGATVRGVALAENAAHRVSYQRSGVEEQLIASWVVDASGRAGLLRRQLGLQTDNGHHANAVWFRLGTRIDIDDWSEDAAWHARCVRRERWLSTNHFVGAGYWAWLIPLSSGAHSVGIVADEALHPLREINSFARALAWLTRHQPQLAEAVAANQNKLLDFVALKRFSYGCERVFSPQRWALTGEAGLFLDPFYSPGTDFIAISNTYICELIARDRAGESLVVHASVFEQMYFSFYESTLSLFRNQYPIFGNAEVMPVKVIWDYTYYWGILAQFFFQRRLTDLSAMSRLKSDLMAVKKLNGLIQNLFRRWSDAGPGQNPNRMLDQAALPWFAELNRSLLDELDARAFQERIRTNSQLLRELATQVVERVHRGAPSVDTREVEEVLGAHVEGERLQDALLFAPAA